MSTKRKNDDLDESDDTPVMAEPAAPVATLITLTRGEDTLETTEDNWRECRGIYESQGWRYGERTLLTPPGEVYQHHAGTGFVKE